MRSSIHAAIEVFRKNNADCFVLDSGDWKSLERELLIIMSTPEPTERTDLAIQAAVTHVRVCLGVDKEPYDEYLSKWLDAQPMPYVWQKVFQNIAAYAFQQGFNRHKERGGLWEVR